VPRHIGPRKYEPLTRFLATLAVDEVTLTLAEIEQIIGAPLPASARQPAYWSNGVSGIVTRPPGRGRGGGWRGPRCGGGRRR
jgi:hypothetical protein